MTAIPLCPPSVSSGVVGVIIPFVASALSCWAFPNIFHRVALVGDVYNGGMSKERCYHRRWKIERTNAWIQNFRRLVVRYDRKIEMFDAFLQLGCTIITLNKL